MKKNTIPKVIHYCWFGGNEKSELIINCINSWKKMCPDYKIVEWNEKNFDLNQSKFAYEAYNSKKWAFVSDYVRLKVIYEYGGIYLDTDVELIKNLDNFLNCNGFFSTEDNVTISTGLGFGATKHNEIVKRMIDDYECELFILPNGKYNDEACPIKNSRSINYILNEFKDRTIICEYENNYFYPKEYFCPLNNISGELIITDNTVAIHHYSGSWLDNKELKIKINRRKIVKLFGKRLGLIICNIYTLPYRISKKIKLFGVKETINIALRKIKKKKER